MFCTQIATDLMNKIKGNTVQSNVTHVEDVEEITVLRYFTSSNYIVYHNSNYSN